MIFLDFFQIVNALILSEIIFILQEDCMNKSHCYFLGENQPKFHEPWQIHATRKMDEVSCI